MTEQSLGATHRPVDPASQRVARITGWLFVITFISAIAALLLYDPVLNDADYVVGDGADARVRLGALLEIILAITNIGTAVVLFPILKRLLAIPEIAWEASLGVYLIVRGFKPSPILE